MSIFVHLTSYCDPELVPSIKDCLEKANLPHELTFGICWQHTPEDTAMAEFEDNPQFRIDDIPHTEARGCCWARHRSQSLYRGEDYVLQLDGHQRFACGWDDTLIDMMQSTGVEKPCITSYAGSYSAEKGFHQGVPWCIIPKPFDRDGSLQFIPKAIPDWVMRSKPVQARIASGHFFFTLGKHCLEVPYDPDLYFLGEELVMAVRSFTHGYDLFHPHRLVVWHQYHRDGRKKFWGDQPQKHRDLDRISKARVLKLMGMEDNDQDLTGYGLGTVRTLEDFERYVGIDFKGRRQHVDAIEGIEPPTTVDDRMTSNRKVFVQWPGDVELPERCRFVAYIVEDDEHNVLWRKDVHDKDDFKCPPVVEVRSVKPPAHLVVWPYTYDNQWGPKKYQLPLRNEELYIV